MLVIAYVLKEHLNSYTSYLQKEDSLGVFFFLLLLHRVVLQAPARDSGDIWDVCISELLVSQVVRVEISALVFVCI